ncbi:MAG: type II toxin-antitoxin system VapC family toxin, partial [Caldilineaceae bacterium SB0661_bin_34]|nr:type II toxin-antitoxin system VapC family toxin [Caldilineaceae bacterium SB0661_bin_34]
MIRLFFDDGKPGPVTRRAVDDAWQDGAVAVSAITFWEIAMLHAKGKMELAIDFGTWRASLLQRGLKEIPVDGEIGIRA